MVSPPVIIITLRNLRFSQSILVTAVCYFAKSPIFAKYIGHRGLLLCEIFDFRKVYWSPRFVCVSVCLSVCLFVCQFAMYRPHHWSDRPDILTDDVFWTKDYGQFFFWKSDKGQGQGHHFCENQIMGHNFWTGSGRDFSLVAERSLYNSASVRDVRRHVFTSRDFNKFNENHIIAHNFWTGSSRDFWLADKCSL